MMLPPCKISKITPCRTKIGGARLLWSVVSTKILLPIVYRDFRTVSAACYILLHALKPTCIATCGGSIAKVFRGAGLSQVIPSVITSVVINMVNLQLWPIACHPKPYDTMNEVAPTVDSYAPSQCSIRMWPASYLPNLDLFSVRDAPSKITIAWAIIEQLAYILHRKVISGILVDHRDVSQKTGAMYRYCGDCQ